MRPMPIEQYLVNSRRVETGLASAPRSNAALSSAIARAPPLDIQVLTRAAYEDGRREGLAEARLEQADAAARDTIERERLSAMEKEAFRAEEFSQLAGQVVSALAQIESDISTAVARILGGVILHEKALEILNTLSKSLMDILSGDCPPVLTIRGPEAELNILRDKLSAYPVRFDLHVENGSDITVQANSTMVNTQLDAWKILIDGIFN